MPHRIVETLEAHSITLHMFVSASLMLTTGVDFGMPKSGMSLQGPEP